MFRSRRGACFHACRFATLTYPFVTLLGIHTAVADSATHLAYADLGSSGSACCLVPDRSGNYYVVGGAGRQYSDTDISVTKIGPTGRVISTFRFGGSAVDTPKAAALDAAGNMVIVGSTTSEDFPLSNALVTKTLTGAPAAFITKVNPANGIILFSALLGGAAPQSRLVGTVANAVAIDGSENIYVAGETNAPDFPVTPNALLRSGAGGDGFGARPFAFVAKLPPNGDRLVYSTLLGGSTAYCIGGSHCLGKYALNYATGIAVDASGNAIVAGWTNSPGFPVTAGALQTTCKCNEYAGNGFIAKLDNEGSTLVWATFLGGSPHGTSGFPSGRNNIQSLVVDGTGNIIVVGATDANDFPTTAGTVQPAYSNPSPDYWSRTTDGFVTKLNAQGTALVFSTYLGGTADDEVDALTADSQGNLWVSGTTASSDFPGAMKTAALNGAFIAELAPDASRLVKTQAGPDEPAALNMSGNDLRVLGTAGSFLEYPGGQPVASGLTAVGNSAGGVFNGGIAPGEFVSLYGNGLGPVPGLSGTLDANNQLPAELGGVQVLFDGNAAQLLYAANNQINVIAPYALVYSIAGKTSVQVNAPAGTYTVDLYVRAAQPQVFRSGAYDAIATNQDGTLNSSAHPAAPGSTVAIYASGIGTLFGTGQYVSVIQEGYSLEVVYVGSPEGRLPATAPAPIVFRVPSDATGPLACNLVVDGFYSEKFYIAVPPAAHRF